MVPMAGGAARRASGAGEGERSLHLAPRVAAVAPTDAWGLGASDSAAWPRARQARQPWRSRTALAAVRFSGAARSPAVILSASAKGGDAMVSDTKVAALRVASTELFG